MHTIILISGKQGSGKSTLADNLQRVLSNPYRTRFAKVLYMMHDAVRDIGLKYGIPFPQKNGPLLQYLGTEVVRNTYGEDSWVNCVKKELSDLKTPSYVIIDDCRFPNEAQAFDDNKEYKVIKVRLEADREVRKGRTNAWRDNDTHPSETGLDDYNDWDIVWSTVNSTADYVTQKVLDYVSGDYPNGSKLY